MKKWSGINEEVVISGVKRGFAIARATKSRVITMNYAMACKIAEIASENRKRAFDKYINS